MTEYICFPFFALFSSLYVLLFARSFVWWHLVLPCPHHFLPPVIVFKAMTDSPILKSALPALLLLFSCSIVSDFCDRMTAYLMFLSFTVFPPRALPHTHTIGLLMPSKSSHSLSAAWKAKFYTLSSVVGDVSWQLETGHGNIYTMVQLKVINRLSVRSQLLNNSTTYYQGVTTSNRAWTTILLLVMCY